MSLLTPQQREQARKMLFAGETTETTAFYFGIDEADLQMEAFGPVSASDRQYRSRKKLSDEGGRMITVRLSRDASLALEALDGADTEIVNRAILSLLTT